MTDILRPGSRLARRSGGLVQAGPAAGPLVVVADRLRPALDALLVGRPVECPELLTLLRAAGLLVAADSLRGTLPPDEQGQRLVAGLFAEFGDDAPRRLAARSDTGVGIVRAGPAPPDADALRARLGALGLGRGRGRGLVRGRDVTVLLSDGEPTRRQVDRLMAADRPHLLLTVLDTTVRLGPFVIPGRTACLRCYDARRTEDDPGWPTVHTQCTGPAGGWGLVPRDPALLDLALAWAARDVAAYADGDRPATWSATVTIDSELLVPREDLARHPHCGCCWDELTA